MSPRSVTSSVTVAVDPDTAFAMFTDEIACWWRQGPINFYDSTRAYGLRIEAGVGGRVLEVYDSSTGEGLELARVTAWEPGALVGWHELARRRGDRSRASPGPRTARWSRSAPRSPTADRIAAARRGSVSCPRGSVGGRRFATRVPAGRLSRRASPSPFRTATPAPQRGGCATSRRSSPPAKCPRRALASIRRTRGSSSAPGPPRSWCSGHGRCESGQGLRGALGVRRRPRRALRTRTRVARDRARRAAPARCTHVRRRGPRGRLVDVRTGRSAHAGDRLTQSARTAAEFTRTRRP